MVFENFVDLFAWISLILAAIAAFLSYKIYKHARLSNGWIAMIVGFILIIVLRLYLISVDIGLLSMLKPYSKFVESIVRILISSCYIIGLWVMKKAFENFEVIDKRTNEKIKEFEEWSQKQKFTPKSKIKSK